jgi:ATP-dependent protease Clp ATPase subunit
LRSLCEAVLTDAMYELPSSDAKTLKIDLEYAKETLNKNLLKTIRKITGFLKIEPFSHLNRFFCE